MFAADLMTRVVLTVSPHTKLVHAARLMLDHKISGLPVTDEFGRLVGVITEGDLLRRAEIGTDVKTLGWISRLFSANAAAEQYVRGHARTVGDLMTDEPISVASSAPLSEVVTLMERKHIKRLPVLANGRLVGVISRTDILRALVQQLALTPEQPATDDEEIRLRIVHELNDAPWASQINVTVEVEAGRVRLQGVIVDERSRAAMRVLAENVAGVTSVVDELVGADPVSGTYFGVA